MSQSSIVDIQARAATSTELFTLADISSVRNWDYTPPTLTRPHRFTERKAWTNASFFETEFFELYPVLKKISLDNLALMGGSVLSLLTGVFRSKDLDFFVVTDQPELSKEAACEYAHNRVKKFIRDVYTFMVTSNESLKQLQEETQKTKPNFKVDDYKFYKLDDFRVRRVLNVYTITVPQIHNSRRCDVATIQLITTPYTSVAELVQHADLSWTAMTYYNHEVWISERAKFSFENLCFVVDGATADMDRVIKYFDRGFDVIMPHLDETKIRTHNFQFGLKDKKIFLTSMAKCERPPESDEAPAAWTRTSFSTYDQAAEASSLDVGSIIHYNIICLIHGNNDGLVVHGERASYENAFRPRPLITERMFVNSYETVRNSLYNSNSLNLEKLLKYSTVWKPSELLNRLVLSYVAEQEAKGRPGVSILEGTEFEKHFKNVVDELVAQQIVIAKQKIAELEGTPASTLELRNKRSPSLREPPRLPSNCPARLKSGFGLGVEVSLRGYSLAR
ncbi:hypothetical protein LEN26_002597 [Aphanomyces euteiches]|nr:hypothetical protein AeMF1_006458 [Aphanomyces euteiches]KAH9158979.1 hypothetical protein LEN26_002597 [Aphanomyces euteiches]